MDTRYYNPGKVLREWFPDQSSSQRMILLWTLLYLLNLALTMGFSYLFYYSIPDGDGYAPDFSEYLNAEQLDGYRSNGGGYHVLYRAEDGTRRMVLLERSRVFRHRLHLEKRTDQAVPEGDRVPVEIKTILRTESLIVTGDVIDPDIGVQSQRSILGYLVGVNNGPELGIYMFIALLPLGLEMAVHSLLKRVFRGG